MHASYDDITSRIAMPPIWYDEHAVPRYCTFEPKRSASIHIGEIALVEIACQQCERRFRVALSAANFQKQTVAEAIRNKTLHFGDPPRHDVDSNDERICPVGASMNSELLRVLEYWGRYDSRYAEGTRITNYRNWIKWVRDPSLEIVIASE